MDIGTPSETLLEQTRHRPLDGASTQRAPLPPPGPSAEPDTCRICRGEATSKEPLFYPCKCSGSIKYVHQDCLMEWLSHSQKKHCELCKTSFRFAKLYSPNMPKQVPVLVFAHHLAKYFLRKSLVWLRIVLVFFMWMVLLPSMTRWEWSFFFWVSEEGLVSSQQKMVDGLDSIAATSASSSLPASLASAAASIATSAAHTILNGTQAHVQAHIQAQSQHDPADILDGGNRTTPSSFLAIAIRMLLDSFGAPEQMPELAPMLAANNSTQVDYFANTGPPTLLSEVTFLRRLTRFPWLNRWIIYTIEGQFITFLVIVCFILIILVRDYVVQQQPEINMRAAFNAAEEDGINAEDGGADGDHRHHHHNHDHHDHNHNHVHHHHRRRRRHHDDDAEVDHWGFEAEADEDDSDWETDSNSDRENDELLLPLVQGPGTDGSEAERPEAEAAAASGSIPAELNNTSNRDEVGESSSSAANANANANATSNDRNPPSPSEGGATVHEYMRIYRRAGGDQQRILEIAREENLEEHLQYWLRVMQNVAERRQSDRGSIASTVSTATADATGSQDETTTADDVNASRHWFETDQQNGHTLMSRSSSKGKRRADGPEKEDGNDAGDEAENVGSSRSTAPVTEFEYGLRPRANTDGPGGPTRTNPLANNNWSFGPTPLAQPLNAAAASRLDDLPALGQISSSRRSIELIEPELTAQGQLRRRSRPADDAQEQPTTLHRNSTVGSSGMANIVEEADDSSGMANIVEEADDSTALTNNANDSSTDASARVPTPSSTASSLRRPSANDEHDWADVIEEDDTDLAMANAANIAAVLAPANDDDANRRNEAPQQHVPAPAGPAGGPAVAAAGPAPAADGFLGGLANFMWRDLDNIDPADLPPIPAEQDDDAHVALFNEDDGPLPLDEQDREAIEAAAAAAAAADMEAEAIEDAEDLEGVMELLGMRGPLAGLFQNVIFCMFLVTVSLLVGIFMPYNMGRFSIWLVANPMRPVMMLFSLSKLLQDAAASALGGAAYLTLHVVRSTVYLTELIVGHSMPATKYIASSMVTTWDLCATSAARVVDNFNIDPPFLSTGEIRNFSAISHEALIALKGHVGTVATAIGQAFVMITTGEFLTRGPEALNLAKSGGAAAWALLRALPAVLSNPGSWVITLDSLGSIQVNPALAYWGGADRSLAILFGCATMCLIAGLYLHRGSPFANDTAVQEWEASLIDGLNQASGVLKVILIIGIEMLVFPLYCGLLLDVALLPLFEDTTLMSRLYFSIDYPLTSIFVHWFVGTGYMFHFALFVSMCRKIMRKGVLYFIRDPDDPEFHPVRDVLERSVTTQLRKILFSAFVYGALVIICLGGVVWGLAYAGSGILPIHYSSNEPVLEFPIDLLFYNFLMPLAIKFFKPSDGLHAMYTWWFRKSARGLRITWFLFGERRIDEEGVLTLAPTSPHQQSPWIVRLLLEYDEFNEKVVPMQLLYPKQFEDLYGGEYARVDNDDNHPLPNAPSMEYLSLKKRMLVASGQLVPDGRFVRAPASDQVKIPKGKSVFFDITDAGILMQELEDNSAEKVVTELVALNTANRAAVPVAAVDAADAAEGPEGSTTEIYHGKQYQLVYIPPNFRMRVFLFIASIWLFAAVTGVSFTILPLLFGRRLFLMLLPAGVRTNDIYAFSIGIYVLGSASYFVFHARSILRSLVVAVQRTFSAASARSAVQTMVRVVRRAAQLAFAYFFILVVFPLLATTLVELYLLIPLHTYMYPPGASSLSSSVAPDGTEARHTVRIIQSWTLGLLYLKVSARTITSWYPEARLASAIRAVLRRGSLDPDVRLLTRAFVVPGLVLAMAAIGLPLLLAKGLVASTASSPEMTAPTLLQFFLPATVPVPTAVDLRLVYRLSFPFVALVCFAGWSLWGMVGVYASWKLRIRDEVYLIGERLHNFGATTAAPSAARRAFRAGVGRA